MKKLLMTLLVLSSSYTFAAVDQNNNPKDSLENKLDQLNIPSDRVTPLVSRDKLYIVNSRYSNLNKRHELSFAGGNNYTAESHLVNRQMALSYRFHYSSRVSGGIRHTDYQNELSEAGKTLFKNKALVPDSDFAFKSTEAFITYNTIYGKMRVSKTKVVYFDQYVSIGAGKIDLASGEETLTNVDLGVAFWLGSNMSARIGVKNEFYVQGRLNGKEKVHNAVGFIEFGYLFGKGATL